MPSTSHTKAAEAHEPAARTARMVAEHHQKGDHNGGLEHSDKAMKQSETAHEASKVAGVKSKAAAH